MPTLILLRHAKSDTGDPKLDDHDRPLAARGRKDAPLMGKHIRAKKWEPTLVVCSSSARTRETWELVVPELKTKPKVRFERTLYLAPWPSLLAIVQATPPAMSPLMLIGHNPGFEQLAQALAAVPATAAERARSASMAKKFPTCALAVLEFEGTWPAIRPGSGRLAEFARPKDLKGE